MQLSFLCVYLFLPVPELIKLYVSSVFIVFPETPAINIIPAQPLYGFYTRPIALKDIRVQN